MPVSRRAAGRLLAGLCLAASACWLAGCPSASPPAPSPARRPSVKIDLCAERLHDISGQLLFCCGVHKRMPASLAELQAMAPGPKIEYTCPTSGRPYVYRPQGVELPGRGGRAMVYDPAPSHSGMRWAIVLTAGQTGRLPQAKVILLPDAPFRTPPVSPSP